MIDWLDDALWMAALGSLTSAIFCLAMALHCRRPGTSLWSWPGMWATGIWSLPVTERGARYRACFLRAETLAVVCLGLALLLTGGR
jgi:hypothetical protein